MVPDGDMNCKLDTKLEISSNTMGSGNLVKAPQDKLMVLASNYEDGTLGDGATKGLEENTKMECENNGKNNGFHMEVSPPSHDNVKVSKNSNGNNVEIEVDVVREISHMEVSPLGRDSAAASKKCNEDVEVDVVNNVVVDEERVADMETLDLTESSSSFGFSDDDVIGNDAGSSDEAVESEVRDFNRSMSGLGGRNDLLGTRRRKVSSGWRNFVRPLMWRCNWAELRIKELELQAAKYEKQILDSDKNKKSLFEKCENEERGMKSVPFITKNQSVKLMKRKKRKRVEVTTDIPSYTSSHCLFSYYARGKPASGSIFLDHDHRNTGEAHVGKTACGNDEFGTDVEWVSFKDSDAFESLLKKIEESQLQVHQLKLRVDKVLREHTGKLSFVPFDQSASFAPKSQRTSGKTLPVRPGAVLSCGNATPLPKKMVISEQPQSEGECEKVEHESSSHNQLIVKEELIDTEVGNQPDPESVLVSKGQVRRSTRHVPSPNFNRDNQEQSGVKTRSICSMITPKNKRKRGKRKARSRWTWKSL